MNKPTALPQTLNSPGKPGEPFPNAPEEIRMQSQDKPLAEAPHRAAAVTPRIADRLSRIEGIQRWGLNE